MSGNDRKEEKKPLLTKQNIESSQPSAFWTSAIDHDQDDIAKSYHSSLGSVQEEEVPKKPFTQTLGMRDFNANNQLSQSYRSYGGFSRKADSQDAASTSAFSERRPFDISLHHEEDSGSTTGGHRKRLNSKTRNLNQRYRYYSKLAPANKEKALIMPHHIVPPPVLFNFGAKEGDQSDLVTILSLWNTMMGTSLLAMPWALSAAGFGLGVFSILFMMGLTLKTCIIVVDHGQGGVVDGQAVEFSDVVGLVLGKRGYIVSVVTSVMTMGGAMVVYYVLMSSFLYSIVDFIYEPRVGSGGQGNQDLTTEFGRIGGRNETGEDVWHQYWNEQTAPLFLLPLIFPLLNLKSIKFFTKLNSLGIFSILYMLFFVVFTTFFGERYADSPFGGDHLGPYAGEGCRPSHPSESGRGNQTTVSCGVEWAKGGVFKLTGVLMLSYFIHNGALSIMRNARYPKHNKRNLVIAYMLVSCTYMLVGCCFYISYNGDKNEIQDNFLKNFDKSNGNFPFALTAQIFLFLQMITVFPLLMYVIRFQVLSSIWGTDYPSVWHVLTLNAVVTSMFVLVAIFYPHIGDVLRFTGSICGGIYVFIIPVIVERVVLKKSGEYTYLRAAMGLFLCFFAILNIVMQFVPLEFDVV